MTPDEATPLLEALAADLQELPFQNLPDEFQAEFWPAYQVLVTHYSK